jgi:signal transduction histidine kinase
VEPVNTASGGLVHSSRRPGPIRILAAAPTEGWWVLVAGIAAAGGSWLLVLLAGDEEAGLDLETVLAVAVLWSFIASGLIAWVRGPEVRLGRLLVYAGFFMLVGPLLQFSSSSLLFTLGVWLATSWVIVFVLFLLSFPGGRLKSRTDWLLLTPFIVALLPLQILWFLFWDSGEPGNAFLVWDNAEVADAVDWTQRAILALGALIVTGVLARRWLLASSALRRSLTPIFAGGIATVLASATVMLESVGNHTPVLVWVLDATLIVVALAVLADMMRARLAQSAVGELVVELSTKTATTNLREALARALHDPSLQVAFWLPEFEMYADRAGRRLDLRPEAGRATTVVEHASRPVAALLHDASLQKEKALLDAVVAAAGIALENARLESELRARVEELRRSRARIVEVAQAERRRLERDLHDGAQQRLVTLSIQLSGLAQRLNDDPSAIEALAAARSGLDESLRELRELARGIHPAVITERGLAVALDALVLRASIPVEIKVDLDGRLPEVVELAAYYFVSESLTNAAKHARASSASVKVTQDQAVVIVEVVDDGIGGANADGGSGLHGLQDRVEALGGRIQMWSPAGGGTRLRAEIPCRS